VTRQGKGKETKGKEQGSEGPIGEGEDGREGEGEWQGRGGE